LYEMVHAYGILKRNYPVTVKKKSPRQLRYIISDNFYRFWFHFIYKNQSILISNPDAFKALIERDIKTYYGFVFEDIAREFLIELNKQQNRLPFSFLHIDKWWYREEEIDLIAFDEGNNILFCEVKWKYLSMQESIHILDKLKMKTKSVEWKNSRRVEHFAIFAKNIKGKSDIQKKGYLVFDLDDFKEFVKKMWIPSKSVGNLPARCRL
jgi:AAA+ ATPase superfamily predicted ATPase